MVTHWGAPPLITTSKALSLCPTRLEWFASNTSPASLPGFPLWQGVIQPTPTLIRQSVEEYFSTKFALDESFKPLPLEQTKTGKYATNLCTLLWDAAFKEYRVDLKKAAQSMVFTEGSEMLKHLSKSDRDSLAESGG